MCLMFQPLSMNSQASQSSSAGLSGGSPCAPKSSSTFESPIPKIELPQPVDEHAGGQRIFGETIQFARSRRVNRWPSAVGRLREELRHAGLHTSPRFIPASFRGAGSRTMRGSGMDCGHETARNRFLKVCALVHQLAEAHAFGSQRGSDEPKISITRVRCPAVR